MVSFWPFKSGGDAAAFERTLSTLSGKITRAAARNDGLRQKGRRVRVMWTLYAGFAYILAALLLTLVTGWKNWGVYEITTVAGGPVLIYLTRTSLTTYYDYRISSTDAYIKTLTKERDATIERLKEATKYNSTQQLLEKYGSSPKPKSKQAPASSSQKKPQASSKPAQAPGPRTGIAPPPTANIQRQSSQQQQPSTPQRPSTSSSQQGPSPPPQLPSSPQEVPGAEFAPNAFSAAELTRQYSASTAATYTQSHWYDRILDALLGEDETQLKNRLVLICAECRLVNGQAPPGARSLEDVGRWRCGGCHAWNGEEKPREDAVAELVQGWAEERKAKENEMEVGRRPETDSGVDERDKDVKMEDAGVDVAYDVDAVEGHDDYSPPAKSKRSKPEGRSRN